MRSDPSVPPATREPPPARAPVPLLIVAALVWALSTPPRTTATSLADLMATRPLRSPAPPQRQSVRAQPAPERPVRRRRRPAPFRLLLRATRSDAP